jgi:hypothetical protein
MAKMWLLVGLLILASAGCTRRDWVGDMLVLTDVTGEWAGTVAWPGSPSFALVLRQEGPRVAGEASWGGSGTVGNLSGSIQGVVEGELFSFNIIGSANTARGVLTVDGDEMDGVLDFPTGAFANTRCPCRLHLRRSGPAPTPRPQ